MRIFLSTIACVVLCCCATSEVIYLKNANGQTVQCGPYAGYGSLPAQAAQADAKLRGCVSDYQRQGYERVPGP